MNIRKPLFIDTDFGSWEPEQFEKRGLSLDGHDGVIYDNWGEGIDDKGRKAFYLLRQEPNGAYNLLEIYSNRKGNLTTKTYYKTKKGVSQRVMELKSLLPTSETYSEATLFSDSKIPTLFEPTKINSQEVDNGDVSDGNIHFRMMDDESPADIFLSNARVAVENIKQEKATPEQWLAMLQKNGGLKAGEDKWLGLSDWLKDNETKR